MTTLSLDDFENARIVADDLEFITHSWAVNISEGNLRRASPVLRRLLTDGSYGRAWRAVGLVKQPHIPATDLLAQLGTVDRTYVSYAYAGLASSVAVLSGSVTLKNPDVSEGDLMMAMPGYYNGVGPLFMVIPKNVWTKYSLEEEVASSHFFKGMRGRIMTTYPLDKFLLSASVVIGQEIIQRSDIIKYVANKLGGAHFDPKRNPHNRLEAKYRLLDGRHSQLGDLDAIYLEVLSIGQFIAESEDAKRYLETFRQIKGSNS